MLKTHKQHLSSYFRPELGAFATFIYRLIAALFLPFIILLYFAFVINLMSSNTIMVVSK